MPADGSASAEPDRRHGIHSRDGAMSCRAQHKLREASECRPAGRRQPNRL